MSRVVNFGPARHWSETPLAAVLTPLRVFIGSSRSASFLLFLATAVALLLANSSAGPAYDHFLHQELALSFAGWELRHDLLHWINDGLMTIFFVVVGLEIKREFSAGELSSVRAATLPVVAALGGAVVPALVYLALNYGGVGQAGWAVPMATDIAFALGALSLLGDRVPITLKIFLTAVAIVDDLLAVLIIAVFYSGALNFMALGAAAGLLAVLALCNFWGVRSLMVYGVVGVVIWGLFLESGVHATIAGVLVAWTVPARTRIDVTTFKAKLSQLTDEIPQPRDEDSGALREQVEHGTVLQIERLCEAGQAPLQRAEHALHQLASLVIIPLFALANAAVPLASGLSYAAAHQVGWGIGLGLCLGKPLGILGACWVAVRWGLADLPKRTNWYQMLGVSVLAGIGFTMSIFIASLAFSDPRLLNSAKSYILIASSLAMGVGVGLLAYATTAPAGVRERPLANAFAP
jgi:Na+:H+ antiporter, NhaA family